MFIGGPDVEAETPVLWPPDVKSWLIWKDPDAGKNWGQEEKGTTEDEMIGWHHQHNGHGSGWTQGVGDGQGNLACCGSWSCKELDTSEQLNWAELNTELNTCTVPYAANSSFIQPPTESSEFCAHKPPESRLTITPNNHSHISVSLHVSLCSNKMSYLTAPYSPLLPFYRLYPYLFSCSEMSFPSVHICMLKIYLTPNSFLKAHARYIFLYAFNSQALPLCFKMVLTKI